MYVIAVATHKMKDLQVEIVDWKSKKLLHYISVCNIKTRGSTNSLNIIYLIYFKFM